MSKGRPSSTRAQQELYSRVLLRDEYRCMLALPGEWTTKSGQRRHCMGRADCVHHTRGWSRTGDDPLYLVAACSPCNLRVGEVAPTDDPPHRPMTQW